jgi:ribosomal protein L11 methyltransferase
VIRLALRVARADAELVLADLLELAPGGVEEIELPAGDGEESLVEYAVYGAPGELPELPDLRAAVGGALVEVSTSEVADDWSESWKRFHQPVLVEAPVVELVGGGDAGVDSPRGGRGGDAPTEAVPRTRMGRSVLGVSSPAAGEGGDVPAKDAPRTRMGQSLFVRPPWEAPSNRADVLDIAIDPAQAFGTGAHATTHMCLELLLAIAASDDARGAAIDIGAGSGVLAIAAVKLGYEPVLALDNDRESVRATVANAAVNGVEVDARRFDLRHEALPWLAGDWDRRGVPAGLRAPADSERHEPGSGRTVVLANLLRPLLLDLAGTMGDLAAPAAPGQLDLIASGLLCEQADEVAQAFATRLGLRERARLQRGEWAALWLTSARSRLARRP